MFEMPDFKFNVSDLKYKVSDVRSKLSDVRLDNQNGCGNITDCKIWL